MKKTFSLILFGLIAFAPCLYAIPTKINYQGTLKNQGQPASGTKIMQFRITNQDGTSVYWSGPQVPVTVSSGLFSTQISPTNVPWETITPYIEVSVEGQLLLPREAVNASVYATISNDIVDGAITQNKLSNSVSGSLVPAGMIAVFTSTCPAGWNVFTGLQGRFPIGANDATVHAGDSGGNSTHTHGVILSPHTHSISDSTLQVAIGIRNANFDNYLAMQTGTGIGNFSQFTANQWFGYGNGMSKPASIGSNPADVAVSGPRISGGTNIAQFTGPNVTDSQNNIPPYFGVVFCQKQ